MQQQDRRPGECDRGPSKDDPTSITNILGMVISVLDWLKNSGKSRKEDLHCPAVCHVTETLDELRCLTMSFKTPVDEEYHFSDVFYQTEEEVECEPDCPSHTKPSRCKATECRRCCRSLQPVGPCAATKDTLNEALGPTGRKATGEDYWIEEETPPKEMDELDRLLRDDWLDVDGSSEKPTKRCRGLDSVLKKCAQCCRATSTPMSLSSVDTSPSNKYRCGMRNVSLKGTDQEASSSSEPASTSEEGLQDDGEDDEDMSYDYPIPQSPQNALIPTRQVTQASDSICYGSFNPQFFSTMPYRPYKAPQTNHYYHKDGLPYQPDRTYQRLTTSKSVKCPDLSSDKQKCAPPEDCARKLLETMMQLPNCPTSDTNDSDTDSAKNI